MTAAPLAVYEAALRAAATGRTVDLAAVGGPERARPLDATGWCGTSCPGDGALLARCAGATLDVGCGPGRLLARCSTGRPDAGCLGIDVSATAVRLARRRGGDALLRDVFGPVPAEGRWDSVAAGRRQHRHRRRPGRAAAPVPAVVHGAGRVVVEVEPPGRPSWSGPLRLRTGDRHSAPFRWAYVGVDDIAAVADAAALRTLDILDGGGPMVRDAVPGVGLLRRAAARLRAPLPAPPTAAAPRPVAAGAFPSRPRSAALTSRLGSRSGSRSPSAS